MKLLIMQSSPGSHYLKKKLPCRKLFQMTPVHFNALYILHDVQTSRVGVASAKIKKNSSYKAEFIFN